MEPLRFRQVERSAYEDLAGGGFQQICTADDLGYLHGSVVDGDRELIGGNSVFAPDQEVSEVFSGDETLGAELTVVKLDRLAVGNSKAPVDFGFLHAFAFRVEICVVCRRRRFWTARSGINRLIIMRSLGHSSQVFPRTAARINVAACDQ